MKNKKLNLNELKAKSFVTDLEDGKENTVKGGGTTWAYGRCGVLDTNYTACIPK